MPRVSEISHDQGTIRVCDEFDFIASRSFDDKHRVNLGNDVFRLLSKLFTFRSFDIYISRDGYLLLQPMDRTPANEQWIWKNPRIRASFKQALDDAHQGRTTRVGDLNEFLESL